MTRVRFATGSDDYCHPKRFYQAVKVHTGIMGFN